MKKYDSVCAIDWQDGRLMLLDQRLLPQQESYLTFETPAAVAQAIQDMVVRGAPAIGITAAYAVVLAAKQHYARHGKHWRESIPADLEALARSRPTAVNLVWAIERMRKGFAALDGDPVAPLLAEARAIHAEDIAANQRMGELGAGLLGDAQAVLTHCNAGALATGGYGTALGVIRAGWAAGKIKEVFADETRPWLQGARLTAWELLHDAIPVTLLVEGAAAQLMKSGRVQWVIVGSDRIAANGDVANKIGTYSLAVNARHHGVKFMVVAPTSTVDMGCASGDDIPIEQRNAAEVLNAGGGRVAADGAEAWNPAFDVTPHELVDAIVTEKGVVPAPDTDKMKALMMSA